MSWGAVEAEDEVRRWLAGLSSEDFGHAQFYVDLLEREGPLLGEPYTRQLRGNFVSSRKIILLTVFRKTKRREAAEIDRAQHVMRVCISEGHAAEEVDER